MALIENPRGSRGVLSELARVAASDRLSAPLEALFETAELARIANRVIWPAISALRGEEGDWPLEALAEIEGWFEALQPAGITVT